MTITNEYNKVYNKDFLNNDLPDKCANLIIADPPYFEVKGEFDFIWNGFDDYLKDVEKWAIECKRILANNGTLFWYGDAKKIAYSQIIFDKYFKLENSLVWRKKDSMQYQYYSPNLARTFNTHNERILLYSNDVDEIDKSREASERIFVFNKNPFKLFFLKLSKTYNRNKIAKIISKHFKNIKSANAQLSNWELGKCIPSEEVFKTLCEKLNISDNYSKILNKYNIIKKDWEENHRRFFYNPKKYEEVLEFSQESHITRKYDHDTKKPETLTRALILTCSRQNDFVVVPFAGSGTECAMAAKENRNFIGFDIEQKYVDMANKRIEQHKAQQRLF